MLRKRVANIRHRLQSRMPRIPTPGRLLTENFTSTRQSHQDPAEQRDGAVKFRHAVASGWLTTLMAHVML